MIINRIKVKNLFSLENVEIDFTKFSGLTEIEGVNKDYPAPNRSNGAGKSSICESIIFALTGKTLRKTTNPNISKFKTKGAEVTIYLNDGIIIHRELSPTKVRFFINGEWIEKESVTETQKEIEKTLNFSYLNLVTSLVFGQQNNISFFSASPEEKRKLIQNYLNLEHIFSLRDKTLEIKSDISTSLKEAKVKKEVYTEEINRLFERKRKIESDIMEVKKLVSNPKIITFLEENSLDEIKQKEEQREKLLLELERIQAEEKQINFRLKVAGESLNSNTKLSIQGCIKCGYISPSILSTIEQARVDIEILSKELVGVKTQKKKLSEQIDKISIPLSDADLNMIEIMGEMSKDLPGIASDLEHFRKLNQTESEIATRVEEEYHIARFWEKAFSEKGLIKFIIRNILDYINSKLDYYLTFLTADVYKIKLHDTLDFTIKKKNEEVPFDTLSGGEKKSLDLSLCLALNDLVSLVNNVTTNIIFFDEAVESLDHLGIQGFFTLLQEIQTKKKIFVITHDSYFHSLLSEVPKLSLIKENGNTRLNE